MGVAVLCASFMSFGVKRRWFALGAALQLAVATYASHIGGHVHYGDWLKVSPLPTPPPGTPSPYVGGAAVTVTPQVRMYSRTIAIIGGFLILASGAGELYRQKPRSRSLQSTGQVFLGIYLICQVWGGTGGWATTVPSPYHSQSPSPSGLLTAAQQGGPPGLPEPHPGRRAHPAAPLRALRPPRLGLPLRLLRAGGSAGPGRAAPSGHPPHRR